MTLTDQKLAELERLHQAATPPPWAYRSQSHDDWGVVRAGRFFICQARNPASDEEYERRGRLERFDPHENNAAAIVAAHNALPALIAEVRRLRTTTRGSRAVRNDVLEEAARMAEESAEASRVMHNSAASARDRQGTLVHGETWRIGKEIAAAIRALKDASLPDYSGGGS